jgi:hypothetical protein
MLVDFGAKKNGSGRTESHFNGHHIVFDMTSGPSINIRAIPGWNRLLNLLENISWRHSAARKFAE